MYTAAGIMGLIALFVLFCMAVDAGTKLKNTFAAIVQVIYCGWIIYCMVLLVAVLRFLNGQIDQLSGTGF